MAPKDFTLFGSALLGLSLILSSASGAPADAQDLMLTPLIKAGDLDKAKGMAEDNMKLSKVKSEKEVKSYSGYLTIDEKTNSNLFFWFFPAQEHAEKAPVILWVNELPGYTCLKGVFLETGPFYVDEDNKLAARNTSWTKTHSMLYIDAPVGAGFSFADSEAAYAKSSDDEGVELYEALQQFFTLFKELQPNDFYLAGEVYAGSFIPYIMKKIDAENEKAALKINLKGAIMGGPYMHPNQIRKGNFFYNLGLIDENQKKEFAKQNDQVFSHISAGKIDEALTLAASLALGGESLLAKMTGFSDIRNAISSKAPEEIARFTKFIDSKEVHQYLHAGVHKFVELNQNVFNYFSKDIFNDHMPATQEILDKGYRMLIYGGQFDILIVPDRLLEQVNLLKWKGSGDFAKAPRKVWKVENDVAGYAKMGGNLAFVTIRNAGNYAIMDQPEWAYDMVERFLSGKEF